MSTVIADNRSRVTLKEFASPGDRFDVERDSEGRIVLRKLRPSPEELNKLPVAKWKQGKRGLPTLVLPKGIRVTRQQIARALREERDEN